MRYQIKIEDVKKDDILYKTESSTKLFMKGNYCRFERKYYAEEYEDINSGAYFKKGKIVYVEYDGYYEKKGLIKSATYSERLIDHIEIHHKIWGEYD